MSTQEQPEGKISLEALLAHQRFLTALARRLTGNEEDAQDLVQDAWVACLKGPAPRGDHLRGWLAKAVRNGWRNLRRREGERPQRERWAAGGEGGGGQGAGAEEIERELDLRRQVVAAALSLPERYKTAIYLRYYEELSISDLAERTGVPSETARSRLQRGIELLRAKLDRELGSRGSWLMALEAGGLPRAGEAPLPLVPAAPAAGAPAAGAPAAGAPAAGAPAAGAPAAGAPVGALAVVLMASAACVALLVAYELRPRRGFEAQPIPLAQGQPTVPRVAAVAAPPPIEQRSPLGDASTPGAQPEQVSGSPPAAATESSAAVATGAVTPTHSHRIVDHEVHGRVLRADGIPAEGAFVHYGAASTTTDDQGRFTLGLQATTLRRGTEAVRMGHSLIAVGRGQAPAIVPDFSSTLPEDSGTPHHLELTLGAPTRSLSGQIVAANGEPASGWLVTIRDSSRGLYRALVHRSLESLVSGQPEVQAADSEGRFTIEGLLDRPYDVIAWHPESLQHVLAEAVPVHEVSLVLEVPGMERSQRVAGRVVSEAGIPLEGVTVVASLLVGDPGLPDPYVRGRATTTDSGGYFELEDAASQPLRLVVEAGGPSLHARFFHVMDEVPTWDDLELIVPQSCDLVLESHSARAPADMLALLDEDGEKLWIQISMEKAEQMGGMHLWRAIPLWHGPGTQTIQSSENARTVLFYDHGGEEIERRPVRPDPATATTITW